MIYVRPSLKEVCDGKENQEQDQSQDRAEKGPETATDQASDKIQIRLVRHRLRHRAAPFRAKLSDALRRLKGTRVFRASSETQLRGTPVCPARPVPRNAAT